MVWSFTCSMCVVSFLLYSTMFLKDKLCITLFYDLHGCGYQYYVKSKSEATVLAWASQCKRTPMTSVFSLPRERFCLRLRVLGGRSVLDGLGNHDRCFNHICTEPYVIDEVGMNYTFRSRRAVLRPRVSNSALTHFVRLHPCLPRSD